MIKWAGFGGHGDLRGLTRHRICPFPNSDAALKVPLAHTSGSWPLSVQVYGFLIVHLGGSSDVSWVTLITSASTQGTGADIATVTPRSRDVGKMVPTSGLRGHRGRDRLFETALSFYAGRIVTTPGVSSTCTSSPVARRST
jgi:hypothetical protein